jgi:hypothetical protein
LPPLKGAILFIMKIIISWDTTGSMYPALAEVTRRLKETIDPLFQLIPDLQLGFIAHGDYFDRYEPKWSGYTDNIKVLKSFVEAAGITSGFSNGGERYEDIMHMVNALSPDVYIMIADEPPHELYKQISNPLNRKIHEIHIVQYDILTELSNFSGKFYLVRCLDRDDSRTIHRKMSQLAGTPLLSLHQLSDIPELLSALVYHQANELTTYGDTLQSTGKLNVNLANLIDSLLNEGRFSSQVSQQSLVYKDSSLQPIHPTRFQQITVPVGCEIREFVESLGIPYKKGRGFYQLTKAEVIQENKEVILRDRAGLFYTGAEARRIIGIPYGRRGKVYYDRGLPYTVFIQSTSVNRKLVPHTLFLYEVA